MGQIMNEQSKQMQFTQTINYNNKLRRFTQALVTQQFLALFNLRDIAQTGVTGRLSMTIAAEKLYIQHYVKHDDIHKTGST